MALIKQLVFALSMMCFSMHLHATQIQYSVTKLGANLWQYDYSVTNDTLVFPIEEFSVFFDPALYDNLAVALSPGDWDSIVLQPEPALADEGLFDALSLSGGIAPGETRNGFAVQFEYLGAGTPGAQDFAVVDKFIFFTYDSGQTTLAVIPLPPAIWMFLSAVLCGGFFVRRKGVWQAAQAAGVSS